MISNEELIKMFADYVYYFHAYCTSDVEDHEMLKAVLAMLKEQQQQIWEFQDQVEYLTDKQKEQEAEIYKLQKELNYWQYTGIKEGW